MRRLPSKCRERAMELLAHHMVHVLRDDRPSARSCGPERRRAGNFDVQTKSPRLKEVFPFRAANDTGTGHYFQPGGR